MFGTLRYDSTNDRTEFLDRGYGFLADAQNGQPGQHAACDQCRVDKSAVAIDARPPRVTASTPSPGMMDGPNDVEELTTPTQSKTSMKMVHAQLPPYKKSADHSALLAHSQGLQRSMDLFGGPDAQLADEIVPLQQDGLLQELESDFDLLDGNVFDISPDLNLHTAKSFSDFSGNVSGTDLDHELDFAPKPTYGSIPMPYNHHISTAPSAQMTDVHSSQHMSRDDNEEVMWSPSHNVESSKAAKAVHPSDAISRQNSHNPPPTTSSCNCLVIKVSLLHELGSHKVDTSLNEGLANHKACLKKSSSVLHCQLCMSKSESVMLLVLVYERLVSFCETVTDTYLKRHTHVRSRTSSPEPERPHLAVGSYPIDRDEEWDCLLGALTLYQVKTLGRQLLAMRKPASHVLRGSQLSILLACERKMRALVEILRSK
ncbi:MAG: hypothetical protein Q9218_002836 [Villophora microphyllina]